MEIYKEFVFESAHQLPNVPPDHKCAALHGHSYFVRVTVDGPVGAESGWVQDFSDIKLAFKPLYAQLDHHFLNDIPGLKNPTSEVLAVWLWERLEAELPLLSKIEVKETANSGCVYRGR
jgi:6-pyruvoyltetrahydropterin/6-carboxytetrahydropterin synthase